MIPYLYMAFTISSGVRVVRPSVEGAEENPPHWFCQASICSSRVWKKMRSGPAMKSEERVPRKTPVNMTNEKEKIEDPPKRVRKRRTVSVMPEVMRVRLRVLLSARLTISENRLLR